MTRSAEIRAVLRDGKRIRQDSIEIRVMPSRFPHSRAAVIVPRHRQTIVDRNRLKRRLRELVRIELLPAVRLRALDRVIRAAPAAYRRTFDELRGELRRAIGGIAA